MKTVDSCTGIHNTPVLVAFVNAKWQRKEGWLQSGDVRVFFAAERATLKF